MPTELTQNEIEALLAGVTTAPASAHADPDLLAALLAPAPDLGAAGGQEQAPPPPVMTAPFAPPSQATSALSWEAALHLVPGHEQLCRRYPPITERQDPKHGRVIVLAYLEDKKRRVRRNFKIGEYMFFDHPELALVEPDVGDLECRITIKVIKYEVGLRIRFWENGPGGDVAGRSGAIVAREQGLHLERRSPTR